MVKLVTFFLIGMVVLAMFGRLRLPGSGTNRASKPRKCPNCGRYQIGAGKCDCGKGRKG